MKRIVSLTILVLMLFSLALPAAASLPLIIDEAELLSAEEEQQLEERAQSLASTYEMDVVILTVDSLSGSSAQDYADDYYDNNNYGQGTEYSGLLFLLAMEEREWYISTCGNAIYAFTDYGLERLGQLVVPYLSGGDYYGGFTCFLEECAVYFDEYRRGVPIDGYVDSYQPGRNEDVIYYQPEKTASLPISLLVGLIVAAVVVLCMRAAMNTKRPKHSAGDYLKQDSYRLRTQRDLFLYSNVHKVRRQQQSSGGSSVHRSSGGRSHGGRGGGF